MKKVVILTGSELRHTFFRKFIASADEIEVISSYCEGLEKSMEVIVGKETCNDLRKKHLINREQSEKDFFSLFVDYTPDKSNPVILPKGEINSSQYTDAIIQTNPDVLVAFGCSIIKEPLLDAFEGRFLNVHLGLSPYYKGSGTNYWPLVNGEPEYVGATFMYIDPGIDTGEVIHQIKATIVWGDTPSQIGNRLIVDMAYVYREVIRNFEHLKRMPQIQISDPNKVYKRKDFTEESIIQLYNNFKNGLVEKYLTQREERCKYVPIVKNPDIRNIK